ncbi:MAG TPA: hypothetical protein VGU44_00030, partial [Gammaproteobacteria bacterium]|nr:hypothetical protein [Gammaproteobacteria bacterium]
MYQPTALSSSSSRILLDPRLFAQIHLDHRLLGSHLQGCALHKTAGYVLEVLRLFTNESNQSLATTLINKLEHKAVLENISAHFQTLMGLAFKIDEIQQRVGVEGTSAKSLEDFQQKYITPFSDTIFEQLKREGNILIPGGWAGSDRYTPGHAMIYQFIKNEDNSYRFIIYNTGSGLQYHQPVSGAKDKYIPLMEYQIPAGTDVEEIKKFLTNLITPRIAPKLKLMYNSTDSSVDSSWEGKKIYNARRIYEEVIPNN